LARIAPVASRAVGVAVGPTGPWPAYSFVPAFDRPPLSSSAGPPPLDRAPDRPAGGDDDPPLPMSGGPATPGATSGEVGMARLAVSAVDAMMAERPDSTLEAALDVFEVFASGSLTDEVYVLEDVAGKRIAIAPTAVRDKYRRGGTPRRHRSVHPDRRWRSRDRHGAWSEVRLPLRRSRAPAGCRTALWPGGGAPVTPRRVQADDLRALRRRDASPHHRVANDAAGAGRARQRGVHAWRRPMAAPRRPACAARAAHRAVRAPREAVDQARGGDDRRDAEPACGGRLRAP